MTGKDCIRKCFLPSTINKSIQIVKLAYIRARDIGKKYRFIGGG
jgi:hypothetical protein